MPERHQTDGSVTMPDPGAWPEGEAFIHGMHSRVSSSRGFFESVGLEAALDHTVWYCNEKGGTCTLAGSGCTAFLAI